MKADTANRRAIPRNQLRDPLLELKWITDALNGKQIFPNPAEGFGDCAEKLRQVPQMLRKLVGAWQQSGPDLNRLQQQEPTVWANVGQYFKTHPPRLVSRTSGKAGLMLDGFPGITPHEEALRFFVMLITNSEWDKLAGPCLRCGQYYIRRTRRNKCYCSRSCGTSATAIAATRKRRARDQQEKLRNVERLAGRWASAHTKKDWVSWVLERTHDITRNWITRAVKTGNLKPPVHE
jgi:hypothetical protein